MRNLPTTLDSPSKTCPKCAQSLPTTEFRIRSGRTSYEAYCKDCTRDYNRVAYRRRPWCGKSKSHPPKDAVRAHARNLLQSAVRWGKLERLPCAECGAVKSEGHHEDYAKPYEVIWLCKVHHGQKHWKDRARAAEVSSGKSSEVVHPTDSQEGK